MWKGTSRIRERLDECAGNARRVLVPLIIILFLLDVALIACLVISPRSSTVEIAATVSSVPEEGRDACQPDMASEGLSPDSSGAEPEGGELRDTLQRRMVATASGDYADVAGWTGSMPTQGEGRILMFRVSFPNGETAGGAPLEYDKEDSLSHLQVILGDGEASATDGMSDCSFPYESLTAYYLRSSYGRLRITGDAYDYEAKLPRDQYDNDSELLFHEALDALDPQIDYADYDGNGDGVIDCVCIRFAGEDTGWGTTWWSHAFDAGSFAPLEEQAQGSRLDGLSLDSLVMLHTSNVTTLIHEVGHTMGLPDYYHKHTDEEGDSDEDDTESRQETGGIGVTDMMNNNQGDHNAFSKWMLGWIDDGHLVKVTCDDEGAATATIGNRIIRGDEDGHVRVPVKAFSGEGDGGLGYAVAIYPEDDDGQMGPLSDCYVAQYEVASGNQWSSGMPWLMERMRAGEARGFRILRIQGTLAGGANTMRHNDTYDPRHDQLVEAVSALEGDLPSLTTLGASGLFAGIVRAALTSSQPPATGTKSALGFHTSLFQPGDEMTPDTRPSTNFGDGDGARRTGICLRVIEADGDCGILEIWYER